MHLSRKLASIPPLFHLVMWDEEPGTLEACGAKIGEKHMRLGLLVFLALCAGCSDGDENLPEHQRRVGSTKTLNACKQYVLDRAERPSSVDFKHVGSQMDHKPGATSWFTTFTAQSASGAEQTFELRCQLAWDGTLIADFKEAR